MDQWLIIIIWNVFFLLNNNYMLDHVFKVSSFEELKKSDKNYHVFHLSRQKSLEILMILNVDIKIISILDMFTFYKISSNQVICRSIFYFRMFTGNEEIFWLVVVFLSKYNYVSNGGNSCILYPQLTGD